jgi:hypothetical protein
MIVLIVLAAVILLAVVATAVTVHVDGYRKLRAR